jgi:hypothetical protein
MDATPQTEWIKSPLLTFTEAHEYLKIGKSSLHNLVKQNQITPINPVPGRTTFLKSDLDKFIDSKKA